MRALFAFCVVASLGAWAGEPAARPMPKVWNVPGMLDVLDVPGRTEVMGLPVAMHAVRSKEKLDRLMLELRRQFNAAGLFIPPRHHMMQLTREPQLTGLDPDTFIAYTLFFQPNPDGTTTVIITESFLAERSKVKQADAFAPVMPGAKALLQTNTESNTILQYSVKASPEQVKKFNAEALGKQGYRQVEPGVFQRGTDVLRITTKPFENDESLVVVVKMQGDAIEAAAGASAAEGGP